MSWSAIGYGGLLILVIFIGILGALLLLGGENDHSNDTASTDNNGTTSAADSNNDAASSSGQEDTSSSRASNDQKKSANDISDESTVTLNQPIEVGDARWVVTSADRLTRLQNQFGSQLPKQGNFVVVNFTFTNKGRDAKTLSQRTINLYDSSGRKYRPDTDTSVYIPIEKNMFLLGQVNPGVSKDGEVIFSVAPDATGLKLQLSNTNFWKGDKGYVDLDSSLTKETSSFVEEEPTAVEQELPARYKSDHYEPAQDLSAQYESS